MADRAPELPGVSTCAPHRAREVAESFGEDPLRYERTRPRYPDAMVQRVVAALPGLQVLDVGLGTGIAARQFQAAGCTVLGVEVDARMAEFARAGGLVVEIGRFEEWEPAGRLFDAVIAGQSWHWVDPVAGAAKAASVLRPGGRIAPFWNVFEMPDGLRGKVADVHRRVLGGDPFLLGESGGIESYVPRFVEAAAGIREAGGFGAPTQWRFDWDLTVTTEAWLDQIPSYGGYNRLASDQLERLLEELGSVVDAEGGQFTMQYATVVVTAERLSSV